MTHYFPKLADLKANMAKRIFFSTLSSLVSPNESARVPLTNGAIDIIALRQMIPGAKELLEYGTQAAINEAKQFHDQEEIDKLLPSFQSSNPSEALKTLIEFFNRDDWMIMFGGKNWAKICATLLKIYENLSQAQTFRRTNPEKEASSLMEMTAYLNVLDGLAHNTGTIYSKMLELQKDKYDPDYGEKELNHLMDAKELTNPEDVIAEIYPDLAQSDASLTMKDWFNKVKQQSLGFSGDPSLRQNQLKKIRLKKELLQFLNNFEVFPFKKDLQSWIRLPDNVLLSRILLASPRFHSLATAASNTLKAKEFPNNLRPEMVLKLRATKKLGNYNSLPELQFKESLVSLPLHMIRKMVEDSLDLTELMEKGINQITD